MRCAAPSTVAASADIEQGEDIHLPRRDISEPAFGHGQGGTREMVHPGNQEYLRGDKIERPKGGSGSGRGQGKAGDSGEGEDDFVFHLSKEEFMQIFFDDLALPRLTRTQLAETPEMKSHRAGFSNSGTPANLSVIRFDARRDRPPHRDRCRLAGAARRARARAGRAEQGSAVSGARRSSGISSNCASPRCARA
jgi:uncharacterized sporulation protein YeaH/YhbH (DUF444 family)